MVESARPGSGLDQHHLHDVDDKPQYLYTHTEYLYDCIAAVPAVPSSGLWGASLFVVGLGAWMIARRGRTRPTSST
jgi:hypothetical protein